MPPSTENLPRRSRLAVLLDHFATVEDPRDVRRILHPLPEILLLVVCATIADCDDYEDIAAWGNTHLAFLRRFLPYTHGVPGERWLTILMNRINPALFSAVLYPEVWKFALGWGVEPLLGHAPAGAAHPGIPWSC